ncbi:MAG: hypothetical protein QOE12_1437, partial [Mycobacterium sp.]|nr:hypothetical protein [Mycobacterium sp.]
RYCNTAGVALGGVSVLIAAPSSPPRRDVQVPAMQLSNNTRENLDANSPSFADLLQTMGGVENPIVVQNITESDAGVLQGGQPASVPGLGDLLNLGNDGVGTPDPQGKSFIDIGPLLPSDLTFAPPAGR